MAEYTTLSRCPLNRGKVKGISQYREVVISPWRVIYRVEAARVLVVSVIDSRRNVEDILLGRFLN